MAELKGDSHPVAAPTTILLVEDEVLIRMLLAEELRSAGYRVIEASNGNEARDVLATLNQPAVVVTDIRMPGSVNGLELARLVRSHCARQYSRVYLEKLHPDLQTTVPYARCNLRPARDRSAQSRGDITIIGSHRKG